MHIGVCECDKNVNCNHIYITFDLYAGYTHPVLIDFVVVVCVCVCVCVCMCVCVHVFGYASPYKYGGVGGY